MTLLYVIGGLVFLFSLGVRKKLQSTYKRWSQVRSATGRAGGQVARIILDTNQLQAVPVEAVHGQLTDHYDPRRKTLRLARGNYVGNSVAATAVAAHECGHALQDADDYRPMELRTVLVPVANAAARFGLPLAILGSFLGSVTMVQVGILGYTMEMPEQDRYLMSKSALEERLAVMLGGRAAERLVFQQTSTGASNDLERATDLARRMVTEFGMSDALGPVRYVGPAGVSYLGQQAAAQNLSSDIENVIAGEIRRLLDEAQETAFGLLTEHEKALHEIARVLSGRGGDRRGTVARIVAGKATEAALAD